jgi:hypothetical protein
MVPNRVCCVWQAGNLWEAQQRKSIGLALAAWRQELHQKQAARLAAEELHHRACTALVQAAFAALRQEAQLSAAAEEAATVLAQRKQASLCQVQRMQGGFCRATSESTPLSELLCTTHVVANSDTLTLWRRRIPCLPAPLLLP